MYDRKITLPLTESEWRALCDNARTADRTPKLQARHIIKSALGLPTEAPRPLALNEGASLLAAQVGSNNS